MTVYTSAMHEMGALCMVQCVPDMSTSRHSGTSASHIIATRKDWILLTERLAFLCHGQMIRANPMQGHCCQGCAHLDPAEKGSRFMDASSLSCVVLDTPGQLASGTYVQP